MADLDIVRGLIADRPNYDRALALGDGTTNVFQLPNSPVVVDSVSATVNGAAATVSSVDWELGLATLQNPPADQAQVLIVYQWTLLSDARIEELLTLEGSIKLAAAQALDIIGTDEVLVQKRIQILDLQTDGPAVAASLFARAKELRAQVAAGAEDATGESVAAAFGVAQHGWDAQTRRDLRWQGWVDQDA